jgi:glycosyltransferase involved in cell wall biosynthesis
LSTPRLRVHFVNENIGGHATMHTHLRSALDGATDLDASFFDVPPRRGIERLAGVAIPGLAALDADFQPLRGQLARSAIVRRHLSGLTEAPDALHLYTHNAALLSVGHMARVPTVVSLDATNRQNAYRIPGRKPTVLTPATVAAVVPLERRVYRAARQIVTHSSWAADSVLAYGVAASKIQVIPFGIAIPPELPPRPMRARPRIVFVGTSMQRKGGWRLVEIWKRRLAATTDLTLVTLEAISGAPDRIEVRNDVRPGDGKIDDVLADADIFAMPGEIDSFGYAVLEAMAAGLPTVAVRQGAIPELVEDNKTGFLVPLGDDDAFALSLQRLAREASLRQEFGSAARKRVEERFDAGVTTTQLVELIREIAS